MIIDEKKKRIETGIYEKEIYDNLQEVYKNQFSKYVNEENFQIFYDKKEDVSTKKFDDETHTTGDKTIGFKQTTPEIITHNLNIIESFKNFVGKKIHLEEETFNDMNKRINTKLSFINIAKENNKQITNRITTIKNTISQLKSLLKWKKNLKNTKNDYFTNLLEKLNEIDEQLSNLIKYGEMRDENFLYNCKYYKILNNFLVNKKKNVLDIIKQMKIFFDDNDKISNKTQILNMQNLFSFQNFVLYEEYQNITKKIHHIKPILHTICLKEKETVATVLLSFFFYLSIGLNEYMYKRIVNYINLVNFKMQTCKEYLQNENYQNFGNFLSLFKSSINEYCKKKNWKKKFHIDLRTYDQNILTIYKLILKNELQMQIITTEVNKMTEMIQQLNKNLEKDTWKLKNIFSTLPD